MFFEKIKDCLFRRLAITESYRIPLSDENFPGYKIEVGGLTLLAIQCKSLFEYHESGIPSLPQGSTLVVRMLSIRHA
jgi:hypothetical protein